MTKEDPLMKQMQERRKRQNTGSTMGAYQLMGAVRSTENAATPSTFGTTQQSLKNRFEESKDNQNGDSVLDAALAAVKAM